MSKAVMTIHGFLTVKEDFCKLYDYLDCYDEVLAVELPGHNGEVNFKLFTVESTKQAVLSAYDSLRARHDQVDVVGFSMGGALASWLCALRDVHKAVLISPSHKFINPMMPIESAKFYRRLKRNARRNAQGNAAKREAVKRALEPYEENKQIAKRIAKTRTFKYMNAHTLGVFIRLVKLSNKAVKRNSPVDTPALVLWGKLDEVVPQSAVKFVSKHFTNLRTVVYPDVGHAMLYTNRDEVIIPDIMNFLNGL